jgi:hypothetical protein
VDRNVQKAIESLLNDNEAKEAKHFAAALERSDGPKVAAEALYRKFGG